MTLTEEKGFNVISVTGLTPAAAIINTDGMATGDGDIFNSSKVGKRNIVITMAYKSGVSVEQERIKLYQIFKTKQWVRIFYKNESRDVFIDGYVETFEGDLFQRGQMAAVSILCPDPFFKNVEDTNTTFTAVIPMLEFPVEFPEEGIPFSELRVYDEKSVYNAGDTETGVIIRCNFYVLRERMSAQMRLVPQSRVHNHRRADGPLPSPLPPLRQMHDGRGDVSYESAEVLRQGDVDRRYRRKGDGGQGVLRRILRRSDAFGRRTALFLGMGGGAIQGVQGQRSAHMPRYLALRATGRH